MIRIKNGLYYGANILTHVTGFFKRTGPYVPPVIIPVYSEVSAEVITPDQIFSEVEVV